MINPWYTNFKRRKKKKENLLRITRNYARFADIQIAKEDERFSIDLFSLIERNDCLFFSSLRADELMVFEMDVVVRALLSRLKLPSSPFYPFASNFHLDPLSFHFDASIIPRPMFYYLRGNRTCTYNGIKVIFNHSIDGSIHYAA